MKPLIFYPEISVAFCYCHFQLKILFDYVRKLFSSVTLMKTREINIPLWVRISFGRLILYDTEKLYRIFLGFYSVLQDINDRNGLCDYDSSCQRTYQSSSIGTRRWRRVFHSCGENLVGIVVYSTLFKVWFTRIILEYVLFLFMCNFILGSGVVHVFVDTQWSF